MPDRTIAPPIKDAIHFDVKLPPCQQISLDNGTSVYYISDGAEEVAVVEWVYYAGNSFEQAAGVAAAANSLIKNGTSTKSAFQITRHFEFYGAWFSRASYNEYATLTLYCLSKHLKELLPLVRELTTDATFPEKEVDIYQKNSMQRLEVNLKKCEFVANRKIDICLYGADHPYGRVVEKEDIRALSAEALRTFFIEYYGQGTCKIFAAGKLPSNFETLLNEHFGNLPLSNINRNLSHTPAPATTKHFRYVNDHNAVQSAIRIGRPFPNRQHPDFLKALVLNTLLGGYFGSRLMSNIREEKGYTYGIYSFLHNQLQLSAWVVTTEVGVDVAEDAIREIFKEMGRLKQEKVQPEELMLVKNYLMGHQLASLDGPLQVIRRWKSLALYEMGEDYFNATLKVIREITAEDIQELANRYFNKDDFYEIAVS